MGCRSICVIEEDELALMEMMKGISIMKITGH